MSKGKNFGKIKWITITFQSFSMAFNIVKLLTTTIQYYHMHCSISEGWHFAQGNSVSVIPCNVLTDDSNGLSGLMTLLMNTLITLSSLSTSGLGVPPNN